MEGVLVVDKPERLTSHDVVAAARRALQERRIGHTGTLDPLATGVLPLACGRATRLVRFLTASDKDYEATIRFGTTTDTYDITGTATRRSDIRPSREQVERGLEQLSGAYLQMPPAYSAKKVGGKRAYDLARRDAAPELMPVPVTVTRAELVEFDGATAAVALTCSAGFYVRTFAHSLGELVGSGACLERLRRTRSGEFTLVDAVTMDELASDPLRVGERVLPMERLLRGYPTVVLAADDRRRVSHGQEVDAAPSGPAIGTSDWVRLVDGNGQLVALARHGSRPGSLHPAVVLI